MTLLIYTSSKLTGIFVTDHLIAALLNASVTLPIVLALILHTFHITAALMNLSVTLPIVISFDLT